MVDTEQIFQSIQTFSVRERLRLVERVVHALADTSAVGDPAPQGDTDTSLIGLFADDPDAVDETMKTVTDNRRRWNQLDA